MSAEPEFQTSLESGEKLKLVRQAIQNILAEKSNKEDQLLLSGVLSELDSLKEDGRHEALNTSAEREASNNLADEIMEKKEENDHGNTKGGQDDIVKELKKVRRQNFITHCLLSAMIILTVTWQLSEVSLLLRLKDALNHPFRSFGSMLTGIIKGPDRGGPASDWPDNEEHQMEMPSIPIKIPEFPHMDSENENL